jgi:hypothetical protein
VGFHESVIALAPIAAPLMARYFGLQTYAVFWIGAAAILAALVPLALAQDPPGPVAVLSAQPKANGPLMRWPLVLQQAVVVALFGGLMEAAVSGLFALFAPTGTPAEIVAKLNDAVRKASASPDLRTRLGALGLEVLPSTPAELGARMRMEKQRWTKVAKQAGIEPQ